VPDVDYDPMKDLADAFNGVDNDLENEITRLRAANKKLQRTLNQTQRNLDELQKNINLTCSKVLDILRDGQEYGHIEDYTEIKK
jgi:phage shock protein A